MEITFNAAEYYTIFDKNMCWIILDNLNYRKKDSNMKSIS